MRAITSGCATRRESRKIESISREDLIVLTGTPPRWDGAQLGRQNLAALAAASGQYCATATGSHACAEAVRLRTLPDIGLIGPLHISSFVARPGQGQSPTIIWLHTGRVNAPCAPRLDLVVRRLQDPSPTLDLGSSRRVASRLGIFQRRLPFCGYCGKGRIRAPGFCG